MKKIIILILIMILTSTIYGSEGIKLDLLSIGAGANSIGRGNTYIGNSAVSVYYAPGALSFLKKSDIIYQHSELNLGSTYDYFTIAVGINNGFLNKKNKKHNLDLFKLGFTFMQIATADIPITEEGDTLPGTNYPEIIYKGSCSYKATNYAITISKKYSNFGVGITGKYIDMNLYKYYGRGMSSDIGGYFSNNIISGAITFKDILSTGISWRNGIDEALVPELKTILSITFFKRIGWFSDGIGIGLGIDKFLKKGNNFGYHVGIEWNVAGIVPLRFGYDDGDIAFGIGFKSKHLYLDYAYSAREEIKGEHNISLGWKW